MKKLKELMFKGHCAWQSFKSCERGDTNFISMIIIIAIVITLAAGFLVMGESLMDTLKTKVETFINSQG